MIDQPSTDLINTMRDAYMALRCAEAALVLDAETHADAGRIDIANDRNRLAGVAHKAAMAIRPHIGMLEEDLTP